jgi:hypothetical protein
MKLHILPIWTDADTLMQVRVSLTGNGRQSWAEAYSYPDKFSEFGTALINFPTSIADEVLLELGSSDPAYADHLLVRAFVLDGVGHCAVEFKSQCRGDALNSASMHFTVPTEAASLNELGKELVAWSESPSLPFSFEGAGA